MLSHLVALETYVKAFQYKVLHNNLYFIQMKNYSKLVSEQTMFVIFVRLNQKLYNIYFTNALTQGNFGTILNLIGGFYKSTGCLSLQNVIFGIISKQCPLTQLLNYFIIVGKLFLWDCRRNQIKPTIKGYQNKIANKYETECKIKKNHYFEKKWIP